MKNKVFNILKKELRETFRDKKSLGMMLIIPFMIPLIIIGMSALFEMDVNKPENEYNKIGFSYELTEAEENIIKELNIEATVDDINILEEKYNNGEIHIYVSREDNNYIVHGNNDTNTSYASALVEEYFESYKAYLQTEYLVNQNIDSNEFMNIITLEYNIIEEENFFADYILTYAFMFIIMAITVSATYPATDTTAGEKERGTLETLLTFPIKSKDIILGKFLSISISSIITGLISFILMLVSLYFAKDMFEIYSDVNLSLSCLGILFVIFVIIAYSMLISALCIMIASRSKTFKEAQSALTPLTFISFFPSMIAFMIDIDTNIILSCVPFLNYTLLFSDIISNNINIINILLMIISTIILLFVLIKVLIKQYNHEKVLFNN